ncbi:MAG TPA: ComF family protein [Crocinitomicaceae bacterium]|nr:ComF family protein [Crocinitomicaceae bacterium]
MKLINDLLHLVYPNQCLVCEKELAVSEKQICVFCNDAISLTNFHLLTEESSMDKLFWGRIKIQKTYAHFFFEKNKASQNILFSIKYKDNPSLATYFGRELGENLTKIEELKSVDVVFPVPLHPKKKFIRGYNQSDALAKGICETFERKLDVKSVIRTKHSETQTKKSRFQRWDNVSEIFKISSSISSYKHAVIVDDVITTGSTIEAMTNAIRKVHPDVLISVVTLAIAK